MLIKCTSRDRVALPLGLPRFQSVHPSRINYAPVRSASGEGLGSAAIIIVHPESLRTKRLCPNAFKLTTHPRVKRVLRLRVSAHSMYQHACTRAWVCVRAFVIP